MSELLTLQDLANGHLDVKALGEAANGDENTIVTTRTGNTYPSAERAINIMFQNGGLPAKSFPTLAKMNTDGASLADGQLAMVYNETANNGLYVKTSGAWVKAAYDPVTIAKADATTKADAAKAYAAKLFGAPHVLGVINPEGTTLLSRYKIAAGYITKNTGIVTAFRVGTSNGPSEVKLQIYRLKGGVYELIDSQDATVNKSNDKVNLNRFMRAEKDDLIVVTLVSGTFIKGFTYTDDPTYNGSWIINTPTYVIGETSNSFGHHASNVSLEVDIIAQDDEINATPPQTFTPLKYTTQLINDSFKSTVLPVGWAETGGWTATNDGLKSPTVISGFVKVASDNYSVMANRAYRAKIKIINVESIFGLFTTQIEANSGAAGAMVNGTTNKLEITQWNTTTVVASTEIPALVANRSYIIEVIKNGWFSKVSLIDTVTQSVTTIEHLSAGTYEQFHGQGAVTISSGSILLEHFNFNALYPKECHAVLIGDSNGERAANVAPNNTWMFQLAKLRETNADVIVAARSGDETPNFLKRKEYDLKVWQPKYVVWALGTNDTSQAVWRTNMQQNIIDTIAIGAEPILTTQIPRTGSQALRDAMNADIKSGYFGNYRYIDFAQAVSLNNDSVTWNPNFNSGDGVHVNPAGQTKMLAQALIDIPDLLY